MSASRIDGNLCDFMVWVKLPVFDAPDEWTAVWNGSLSECLVQIVELRSRTRGFNMRLCPENIPPDWSDSPGRYLI